MYQTLFHWISFREERKKRQEKEERRMYFSLFIDSNNRFDYFQKDDDEGWTLPESQFVTELIKPSTETYQSSFIHHEKISSLIILIFDRFLGNSR